MKTAMIRFLVLSTASLLFLLPFNLRAMSGPEYNFALKTEAHIVRIAAHAVSLLSDPEFLEMFPEFKIFTGEESIKLFIQSMLEHDATKIRVDELYLKKHDLPSGQESILAFLTANDEVTFEELPPNELRARLAKKSLLNQADKKHMSETLTKNGYTNQEAELFYRIEEVVDKYDRYIAGTDIKKTDRMPPSEYIWTVKNDTRSFEEKRAMEYLMKYVESRSELYHFAVQRLELDPVRYIRHRKGGLNSLSFVGLKVHFTQHIMLNLNGPQYCSLVFAY